MTVPSHSLLLKISSQSSLQKICPLPRDFGRAKEQTTIHPTEQNKNDCGRFAGQIKRPVQPVRIIQNLPADHTGLQVQFERVDLIAGESSGVVDAPRCGSHRTAMPTEERRGYGVSRRFLRSLKFGVAGTPVLNFGVKNTAAEMGKARNKGISGNKIRCCTLV